MDHLCTQICAYLKALGKIAKPTVHVNSCRISNGLLIKTDCLWILEGEQLRLNIIKKVHDQSAVGHPGTKRTLNMLRRYYYWPSMCGEIEQYFRNCHVCKRAKSARDAYNSFFQPLPVPERPWIDMIMDFMVSLSKSQGFDAILMVVD